MGIKSAESHLNLLTKPKNIFTNLIPKNRQNFLIIFQIAPLYINHINYQNLSLNIMEYLHKVKFCTNKTI
jgi:hypothetical protein